MERQLLFCSFQTNCYRREQERMRDGCKTRAMRQLLKDICVVLTFLGSWFHFYFFPQVLEKPTLFPAFLITGEGTSSHSSSSAQRRSSCLINHWRTLQCSCFWSTISVNGPGWQMNSIVSSQIGGFASNFDRVFEVGGLNSVLFGVFSREHISEEHLGIWWHCSICKTLCNTVARTNH